MEAAQLALFDRVRPEPEGLSFVSPNIEQELI
jgi:hypothetical protein